MFVKKSVPKYVAGLYMILLFFTLFLCYLTPFLTLAYKQTHTNVVRKVWYLDENLDIIKAWIQKELIYVISL